MFGPGYKLLLNFASLKAAQRSSQSRNDAVICFYYILTFFSLLYFNSARK